MDAIGWDGKSFDAKSKVKSKNTPGDKTYRTF